MKAVLLGDAMIPGKGFGEAWEKHMKQYGSNIVVGNWESDWGQLQYRRLEVEKRGPEIEVVDETILQEGKDAEALMGLFVPVSSKVMEAMPNLRLVGVSRAGLENVNVEEATKRGILVFNVKGRNAHAVSDFAIGMMLAAARNIAKAHYAIQKGEWRKTFVNSSTIPEMHDKIIGLVGFGYIGKLVAKKLSGFDANIVVYDPYTSAKEIENAGARKVELDELMRTSDFVSMHARLTDETKKMIGENELGMMKNTAYFINTGRAGLVDQDALAKALKEQTIMGAALDVFTTEPIPEDSPFLKLDNVTLTTHIAGTTSEALTNSPYLLMADIAKFLDGKEADFIVNKEVLEDESLKTWLASIRK
ncbi:MAG: 2-hydroxyacid dehydrogenase [Lachnospiraceae bacterium]